MKKFLVLSVSLLFALTTFSQAYDSVFTESQGTAAGSILYYLKDAKEGEHPLHILLHGIGEQGDGKLAALKKLAKHENYFAAEKFSRQYNMFVLEPQTDNNWEKSEVDEAIASVRAGPYAKYINWKKVYLTGTSLGGGGCYQWLSTHPNGHEIIAACSPNGSGGHQWFVTTKMGSSKPADQAGPEGVLVRSKVPTWAFHNKGDNVVWPEASTTYFLKKKKELGGSWPYWVSINNMNGHTFPAYQRSKGSTLSTGLTYLVNPEYISTPKVNLYEWLLMNEVGQPPVAPPEVTIVSPVPAPGTPKPTPTPPPQQPAVAVYIKDVNYSLKSDFLTIQWDNGPEVIKPSSGDAITNVYHRLIGGRHVLTVQYSKAPAKTFGPKRQ